MSIGTVVFFGLLVSTFLGLFVVPVMYRIIKGWELGRPRPAGMSAQS